jgi:TPR repeat protein
MKILAALLLSAALCGAACARQAEPDAATAAWRTGLAYRNGAERNGSGAGKDAGEALRWLRRAAELGKPEAMFILAQMLAAGEGTEGNRAAPDEARRWLDAAAELDYPEALQALALGEQDPERAALLMKRAAHALGHRAHGE